MAPADKYKTNKQQTHSGENQAGNENQKLGNQYVETVVAARNLAQAS